MAKPDKSQLDKFKAFARDLEIDDDPQRSTSAEEAREVPAGAGVG